MCQENHYSPTTSLNHLHKAQLISVFNWDSSDQATCFQFSTVQFSKTVQIVASVLCSWQTGLDLVWSSAAVAHMRQGLMNWAFRDNLFHSLVVTSSYLTVWPFMKSNPSRSAISEYSDQPGHIQCHLMHLSSPLCGVVIYYQSTKNISHLIFVCICDWLSCVFY